MIARLVQIGATGVDVIKATMAISTTICYTPYAVRHTPLAAT